MTVGFGRDFAVVLDWDWLLAIFQLFQGGMAGESGWGLGWIWGCFSTRRGLCVVVGAVAGKNPGGKLAGGDGF